MTPFKVGGVEGHLRRTDRGGLDWHAGPDELPTYRAFPNNVGTIHAWVFMRERSADPVPDEFRAIAVLLLTP